MKWWWNRAWKTAQLKWSMARRNGRTVQFTDEEIERCNRLNRAIQQWAKEKDIPQRMIPPVGLKGEPAAYVIIDDPWEAPAPGDEANHRAVMDWWDEVYAGPKPFQGAMIVTGAGPTNADLATHLTSHPPALPPIPTEFCSCDTAEHCIVRGEVRGKRPRCVKADWMAVAKRNASNCYGDRGEAHDYTDNPPNS